MRKSRANILLNKGLIVPAMAIVCYLFTELLSHNPEFVEQYYSQELYPLLARILSNVSGIFPFSLDDTFYVLLVIAVLSLVVLLILKKIKIKQAILILLNILASVYILFYMLWGFNYFRLNISERIELQSRTVDKAEFITITETLIAETNLLHCSFENMDRNMVDTIIEVSYKKLSPVLRINYPMGKRKDKKITFSSFYAKTGISGYYGPFFNEVHVNKKVTLIEYPFVFAHEKAHQFGITSEAEANFYAWLVCTNSTMQQLKYSANLIVLRHFLIQAYSLPEYSELIEKIDNAVKKDINFIRQHWLNLRNEKMDKAASKVNDVYLKTNNVESGIKDYNGVVKHVMNFSLDSAFQERHNLATN